MMRYRQCRKCGRLRRFTLSSYRITTFTVTRTWVDLKGHSVTEVAPTAAGAVRIMKATYRPALRHMMSSTNVLWETLKAR